MWKLYDIKKCDIKKSAHREMKRWIKRKSKNTNLNECAKCALYSVYIISYIYLYIVHLLQKPFWPRNELSTSVHREFKLMNQVLHATGHETNMKPMASKEEKKST